MKVNWKYYFRPTPKRLRVLGDTLLAMTSLFAGVSILEDSKVLAIVLLSVGVVGKFLSNFFGEDPDPNSEG